MISAIRSASLKRLMWVYLSILWICSMGEWAIATYCRYILHLGYPYSTALLLPEARFSDWYNFLPRTAHFGEAGMLTRPDLFLPFPYPLPSIIPYVVIQHLSSHPIKAYLIITVLCFLGCTALFSWYLQRRFKPSFLVQATVWSTLLVGYPTIFLIDRGNIEVFLWVLIAAGTYSFIKQRPYQAATCFAIAGSMKIYPALLLLLFVPRKQYRAIIYGAFLVCAITAGMLAIVGPTIPQALRDLKPAAKILRDYQIMVLSRGGLRFDHSIFALWKQAVAIFTSGARHRSVDEVNGLLFYSDGRIYSFIAPIAFFGIYVARIRTMPLLNQFISLLLFCLLLPFVSYDYTLVHLYIVLALLLVVYLEGTANDRQIKAISTLVVLLALIFTPISALARHLYGGQVKTLLMLASLWIILAVPIPTRLFLDETWGREHKGVLLET